MMLQIPFVGNRNFQSYREIERNRRFEVGGDTNGKNQKTKTY